MIVFVFKFVDSNGDECIIKFFPEMNRALYIAFSNHHKDVLIYEYDNSQKLKHHLKEHDISLNLIRFIYKLLNNKAFW